MATTSRLNSLYGLETLFGQSSRHLRIIEKVLKHFYLWRIYDVINVRFFRHFAVFGYSKCHKDCRNSWFSHRICILIGSTTLPSLMRYRHFVVELWRHNCRKNAISSLDLFKMTDLYFNMFYFSDHREILPGSRLCKETQSWLSLETTPSILKSCDVTNNLTCHKKFMTSYPGCGKAPTKLPFGRWKLHFGRWKSFWPTIFGRWKYLSA